MTATDANLPYFDTSYLLRIYLEDSGFEKVRELADRGSTVTSAWHTQSEMVAALHRAFRENRLSKEKFQKTLIQFQTDSSDGLYLWLPLTESIQKRLEQFFKEADSTTFLRAADALHLACAAENGFTEVYSHDRHFLAAAPLFGLQGLNILSP